MTFVVRWWQRTKIWGKVRDSCSLLGTGTTVGLEGSHVEGLWVYVVAGVTFAGTLLGIWMADSNADGIADIFQDDPPIAGTQRNENEKTTDS